MATITTNIRWADNTAELRKNLLQGIDTIDAMKTAVDRTVKSLGGEGLFTAANKTAAAIVQLGGVTKLTASEQERANALIEKAIAKYEAMGHTVPTALREIADATRKGSEATGGWLPLLHELGTSWVARVAEGILLRDAIHKILDVMVQGLEVFPEMVHHSIELGSQLLTMSLKTGISVESLSKLRYVAQQTGTDLPSLTTAIFKMQASLGAVGDESKKTQDALGKLHLNLADLKNSKPDEAFTTILEKMRELPTVADRAGVGMALFGKGWREVSQLAVEDVKELMHEAEQLGIVMTTDTAAAAKAAEDGLAALKSQIEGLTVRIGAAFLPAVIGISHDLSEMFKVAVDESNKSLDAMGKSDGFLATVSRAMGTGSGAITAQTELYYVLRDAVIGLVRNGLEPIITAIGFVGTEFNAAKVVFGDLIQIFELLNLQAAKFARIKLNLSDPFKLDPEVDKQLKVINDDIDRMEKSIKARGAALQQSKQNEEDWANSAKSANATIEAALKKIESSHMDVAAVIKHVGDMSRAAAQNSGTATDEMSAKQRAALEKLAEAWERLNALGTTALDTYNALDPSVRGLAEDYLKAGGSVEDITLALRSLFPQLNLQKTQIEAVKTVMEAYAKTLAKVKELEGGRGASLEELNKIGFASHDPENTLKAYDDIKKASKELADLIAQQTLSTTDYQIQKIHEWAAEQKEAYRKTGAEGTEYYALIDRLEVAKTAALLVDNAALLAANDHTLRQIANKAWAIYAEAATAVDGYSEEAIAKFLQIAEASENAAMHVKDHWSLALSQLADMFVKMGQAAGGSMGTLIGSLGQIAVALDAVKHSGQKQVNGQWVDMSPDEKHEQNKTQALAGLAGGIGMGMNADTSKGFNHSMITGMGLDSEHIGQTVALGVATFGISVGVAAVVSALKYLFRDRTMEDVARDAGEKFGTAFSDATNKAIKADIDSGMSEVGAELNNLDKIIADAGGITDKNVTMMTARFHDLFSMMATGQMTQKQVNEQLEKGFPALAKAATDGYGRISEGLKTIIDLNRTFGTESKAIADFLKGQGADAVAGFVDVVAGVITPNILKGWDDLKAKLDSAVASGKGIDEALAAQQHDAYLAKGALEDLGTQAIATYAAMVAAGATPVEAMKAIHPALESIRKAYEDLGLPIDDAALKALLFRDQIVSAAPQLVNGIAGITKEMVALDNMGLLTPKTFAAMQRSGEAMYAQLIAKVHELGGTDADALGMMQDYLHLAAEEAKKLGIPLDENTQKLIDQSKEAGIWQDRMTPQDKLLAGMQSLVDMVDDLVQALKGLPPHVHTTVTTTYETNGKPPWSEDTGTHTHPNPQLPDGWETSFASEAYVRAPTLATIGDVLGGEFVLRPATLNSWLGHAAAMGSEAASIPMSIGGRLMDRTVAQPAGELATVKADPSGAAQSGDLHITMTLEGDPIGRTVVKNFRTNKGGLRSDALAALGLKVTTWSAE